MQALVFGCGYLGGVYATRLKHEGWSVAGTSRDRRKRDYLASMGIEPVDPDDAAALAGQARVADAVLVTSAPDANGCPALAVLPRALARAGAFPAWLGYVSTTGVYGDRDGGWVDERSATNAATVEAARRLAAERDWFEVGRGMGLTVCAFRLPAIYGPGRAPFEKLRDGAARLVRKPGQVFNRIHVEDAVSGLLASMARPRPGGIYNLCDDSPAGADAYTAFAASLLGLPSPPEVDWTDPSVAAGMRRFYLDNKRVSNARAKAELGWRPAFADWRDGLRAILSGENDRS